MKKLYQYLSALLICTLQLQNIQSVMAAPVSIADSPLNTGGVDVVRPNIMLLMDDSGSMARQYTPDYISGASLCRNSATAISGSTPSARLGSIADNCSNVAPPYYNSDVNFQYYNPEMLYAPPVKADLSSWTSMTAANTTNWTAVPIDGYGIQSTSTRNLVTGYPSYYFCDNSDNNCEHDTNYNFPELTGLKRTNQNTATTAAHYYTLQTKQYCSDEALRNCVNSTSPTGIYTYPAKVRFCTDTNYTTCQKIYSSETGYFVPNYLGNPASVATASKATIRVVAITASTVAKITSLVIDGHELAGSGISLNYTTPTLAATGIKNAINSAMSVAGYNDFTATSSGDTITLTANTIDSAFNGKTVSIQSTISPGVSAVWTVTIKKANIGVTTTTPAAIQVTTYQSQAQTTTRSFDKSTYTLQEQTTQRKYTKVTNKLQKQTKSGSTWGGWSNQGRCTVSATTNCQYNPIGTTQTGQSSCTNYSQSTSPYSGDKITCTPVDTTSGYANKSSCTEDTVQPNTTQCRYNPVAAVTSVSSCADASQTGPSYNAPKVVCSGPIDTVTSPWANAASCTVDTVLPVTTECRYVDGGTNNQTSCPTPTTYSASPYRTYYACGPDTGSISSTAYSLNANNCLNPVASTTPSSLISVGGAAVSTLGTTICNSTTGAAQFNLSAMMNGSNYTSAFTPVTGPVAAYPDVQFSFKKTIPAGLTDNGPCSINPSTSGATNISGSSCSQTTTATQEGATFSVQGATAGLTSTGTTAGGTDGTTGGTWQRVTIQTGQTYPKVSARTDCIGTVCTYAEEMTNFANWHAYYRTRMQSAKSAAGIAFSRLNANFRVGYANINTPTTITEVAKFDLVDLTKRTAWYQKLYEENPGSGTPLRSALSQMGRYFGGKLGGTDPVEYSCQKNYTILVTDGYWNGGGGVDINNVSLSTSQDSTLGAYVTRASGVFDGHNIGNTLSDVAQYYYSIDMRTGVSDPKAKNNVPTNSKDTNTGQHMNTYTMGLGIDGLMQYKKNYATSSTGDFAKITSGASNCLWEASTTDVCNWPIPVADDPTTADDLWHAAINGRGQYFSAKSPADAAEGLKAALSDVVTVTGSAAASATSSPNVTQSDNYIYSSTYETGLWDGEIVAQRIDTSNGNVLPAVEWRATTTVNAQADALAATTVITSANLSSVHADGNANARKLITLDTTLSSSTYDKTKLFGYATLSATERGWFADHCTNKHLAQCAENKITPIRIPFADSSQNMVNFLRGANNPTAFANAIDTSLDPDVIDPTSFGFLDLYRPLRNQRLGDTVNAIPHYVNKPTYLFDYSLPSGHEDYTAFKTRMASRPGALYIGANDGMLHSFHGATGTELFGYIPRTVMPEMWRLADNNYTTQHRYFVDGSPVSMDVTNSTTQQWHTVLVGGYRKGGTGFYSLDVTDPVNPKVLWEVCNNSTMCPNNTLSNMGYSFAKPIITRLPSGNTNAGKWVVLLSSGYNNVPTTLPQPTAGASGAGDGKGYLYVLDVLTGQLLDTYTTGVGSTTTPSGLGQLSAVASNFYYDGTSTLVYGGDLLGNVWRFDLTQPTSATAAQRVKKVVTLTNDAGQVQPVTSRIELGGVPNDVEHPILFIGTGQYLSIDDLSNTNTQSIYAIKDPFVGETGSTMSTSRSNMVEQSVVDVGGVRTTANATTGTVAQQSAPPPVDWGTKNGWYIDLPDTGERVSIDPTLNLGTLLVASNVVEGTTANACEVGGYSWLYQLDFKTGQYIKTATANAAALKVPNSLIVGNVVIRLPSGVMKVITTTATGTKLPYGLALNIGSSLGKRISWREIPQ